MKSEHESRSVVSDSLWPHGLYSPWNSPGHNTGVGSLSLLQGIFPTQGPKLGLLHCRQILYHLSHQGSPQICRWHHCNGRKWRGTKEPLDEGERVVWCSASCSVVSDSLWPHGLYSPWNSPGQDTGVDSLSLLQGIFPTQGSNPGLPLCRQIIYQLSHKQSPKVKEGNEKSGLNSTFEK